MHMSSYTNTILAKQCIISSDKLLEKFTQFTVPKSLFNCFITKLWNVSHILLILMSCEMYTSYVGFAGILLDIIIRKVNYVKIKGIPFVIDLSNIFTTT